MQYNHDAEAKDQIAFSLRCHCVLATTIEFSPRPFYVSAMTILRSCHAVEDAITLFIGSFGLLYVCCTFATGSHPAYKTFIKFSINISSNSSHYHLSFNQCHMNQELLLQLVLLQGHEVLLAQAALVLVILGEFIEGIEGREDNHDLAVCVLGFLLGLVFIRSGRTQ